MVKKVTAPKSYDPGKGRPKEHLAYLNEREMAYLRSINGNNMERGPRGLPSFPPDDSLGSNSGNSKPTGGGSKGPGGPSGPNSGPSGGLGGGGKGGTSSPSAGSKAATSSTPKASTSAPSTSFSAPKTPSSPMGGQGQSFRSPMGAGWSNRDFIDRQKAQVNDTRAAIKSTPAVRNDLAVGGIRTLNVGPIGTPVKVGGSPAVGTKQFYDRVPQTGATRPSASSVPSGMKYSSPLTPGMTQEDMARRGALMNKYEQEIRDLMRGTPTRTGDPISAGGNPTQKKSITPTGNPNIVGGLLNVSVPDRVDLSDVYGPSLPKERIISVEDFPDASIKQKIADESVYTMGLHGYPKEQMLRPGMYADPSTPSKISKAVADAEAYRDMVASLNRETQKISGVDDVYDPSGEFNQEPKIPNWAQSTYTGQRPSVADASSPEPSGVESSGEVLSEDGYGYPTNPDGSPITAEDIANMPPEIQREYYDKVRYSRRYDTPYPLTSEQKVKGYAVGIGTAPVRRGPVGLLLKAASHVPGVVGEAAEKLSNPRAAVNEYDRMNPLRRQQVAERAGKKPGYGGSTVTTSSGGDTSDIGTGGKAERRFLDQVAKPEEEKPKPKNEAGSRPAIYYKWDLGIDIPSPNDSGYNLYLKYLEEKAATA